MHVCHYLFVYLFIHLFYLLLQDKFAKQLDKQLQKQYFEFEKVSLLQVQCSILKRKS